MGPVYRVADPTLKVLPAEVATDTERLERPREPQRPHVPPFFSETTPGRRTPLSSQSGAPARIEATRQIRQAIPRNALSAS